MDISSSTVTVTSYDGHNINDGTNYRATFPNGMGLISETEPLFVERLDDYPVDARTKLKERTINLQITRVAGTLDTLKGYLYPGQMEAKALVVTDSSDSSTWYVNAKIRNITKRKGGTNLYDVTLSVANPIWQKVTATTESWTVTSSGQTHDVVVGGNVPALPVITITPRAVNTSGYTYKRFVTVYNPTTRPMINYPLNFTGGNFDHASLVSGGKAQADGDDFRLWMDDIQRDTWTGGGGYNSATLRPWMNINLDGKIELLTLGGIASTGAVSTISFTPSDANIKALVDLSKITGYKILLIDSELFTFTGIIATKGEYSITGVTRAAFGSSMAAHASGSTAIRIQHKIWCVYGLSTATARTPAATPNSTEPMLDKTNSTNTSWVWTDYFDPDNPNRSAQWQKQIISYKNLSAVGHYGANHNTNRLFESVASEMGMSIRSWLGLVWTPHTAELQWSIYIPSGATTATASGEKYRVSTSWPTITANGLQVSYNGRVWDDVWVEASPASATTWTALSTHSAVSLGGTYQHLRFVLGGTVAGSASNAMYIEYDGITLALSSALVPQVVFGAEQSQYHFDTKIKNNTTGDYIVLEIPSSVDATITVDCENKTVTDGEGANALGSLSYGPEKVRQNWLTLDPNEGSGTNVISVTEVGVNDVDIDFAWKARSL